MVAFRIITGLLIVTCLYNDVALASEPAESSDMSVTESNGLAALEIKIEAEQVQDENSVLLKRIINLADDILAEAVDAIGELSPAGMQVEIDARQNDRYMVDHCESMKEIAYKLWKDGKNVTVEIEEAAESVLDTESTKLMNSKPVTGEENDDDSEESQEVDDDDDDDDDDDNDDDDDDDNDDDDDEDERKRRSPTTETVEGASTPVAMTTSVVSVISTIYPMIVEPPVNVEEKAGQIVKMADQNRAEFEQELETVIVLCMEIKVVMEFQGNNIFYHEEAVAETQEDVRDTEKEISAFCNKIISAALEIVSQNSKSMDIIKIFASGIKNEEV